MVNELFGRLGSKNIARKKLSGHGPLHALPGPAADGVLRWEGLDLRFDCNIVTISGGLGEGRELGIEAQVCKLSDQTLGPQVLRAAIEMVSTEILELRAVLEHVVDRREQ